MKLGELWKKHPTEAYYLDNGVKQGYIMELKYTEGYRGGPGIHVSILNLEEQRYSFLTLEDFRRNYKKVADQVLSQVITLVIGDRMYAIGEYHRLEQVREFKPENLRRGPAAADYIEYYMEVKREITSH